MKVSIVTISFNQASFLEEALTSVLSQDYPDLEYIVVDAGSSDGSRDLIRRYRTQISEVIFEADAGPADGLNKGFARATGDVFAYLNADDMLLPGAVRGAVTAFKEHKHAGVLCGHGYLIDRDGTVIRRLRTTPFRSAKRFAYGATWVLQQSTFIRADAFRDVGGFNRTNHVCWDAELLLNLALAGNEIRTVDAYWSQFRLYPESISGSQLLRGSQQLQEETKRHRRRMLEDALGRPIGRLDLLQRKTARIEKWLTDPTSFMLRVGDAMFRRTR